MTRGIIIAFLIVIAMLLVFNTTYGTAGAREERDADDLARILKNQNLILEKLGTMDKKLNQLKMRIRQ